MGWVFILVSLILPWVAYFCKILSILRSSSHSSFGSENKNVLLVISHPDDESMFFTPIITHLNSRGYNLHLLCLSIGNADGMGNTRKDELYRACAALKVPLKQVKVLDHPNLQDGFGQVWDHNFLADIIKEEVSTKGIDMIITFDNYGVSGHCNHCDVHYGVRFMLHYSDGWTISISKLFQDASQNIEAWELVSTNILRKYSGPLDVWLSMLLSMKYAKAATLCVLNEHPRQTFRAMAEHSSQWVWFRKLFITFSSYTYVNTLRKVK